MEGSKTCFYQSDKKINLEYRIRQKSVSITPIIKSFLNEDNCYYIMRDRITFILLFLLVMTPIRLLGQNSITFDTSDEYYYRLLQISGISDDPVSFNLRPFSRSETIETTHPWQNILDTTNETEQGLSFNHHSLKFFEPVLFQSYNTNLPRGSNDGPVWQGRGYNVSFTTGVKASMGPLSIRFRPIVGMAQNGSFELAPYTLEQVRNSMYQGTPLHEYTYRDFRGSIDYVQRYGDSTYSWFDLGDSAIELNYSGFRLAFSNRQIWSGPAVNTSLQYGYSGPGFRHLYAGTNRPVNSIIGGFEFAYIFGKTLESDFYTVDRVVDSQSVNSLIFIYRPWFADHFSIGLIRTFFHEYPSSFSEYKTQAKKLFQPSLKKRLATEDNPSGNSPDNQMGVVFFRYYIPNYGFEIYWEYGRNDHNDDLRDFLAQPNHHRAYTLGLTKTVSLPQNRLLAINFEMNQLEAMRTALTRGDGHLGGWYTHANQILGFTNNGQILGTGYGPGVNMQMLKGDMFNEEGSIGFKLARITYHNSRLDQFFDQIEEANAEPIERWEVRNVELMIGAEIKRFLPHNFEISAVIEQSFIMNQHHIKENDLANTRFELVIRKQIDGWLR